MKLFRVSAGIGGGARFLGKSLSSSIIIQSLLLSFARCPFTTVFSASTLSDIFRWPSSSSPFCRLAGGLSWSLACCSLCHIYWSTGQVIEGDKW